MFRLRCIHASILESYFVQGTVLLNPLFKLNASIVYKDDWKAASM